MKSVAIIGRPNVGKSALFNRLAGQKISIVHNQPGMTRDHIVAICRLGRFPFEIIDTKGMIGECDATNAVMKGAELALLTTDAQTGMVPLDAGIAKQLRVTNTQPVILVVNKVDDERQENVLADFTTLGYPSVGVSAIHNRGITELLLLIERLLNTKITKIERTTQPIFRRCPRIAIIGQTNVGKSSLVNAILDENRMLVGDAPGTTRDTVDITYNYYGINYTFCDTAGIRSRKNRDSAEAVSIAQSMKTIERSDLCLLVLDAQLGVTRQDKKIAGLIQKAHKAVIILLNKWDLVMQNQDKKKQEKFLHEFAKKTRRSLFSISFAPVIALSAKTRRHVMEVFSMVRRVSQYAAHQVGTGELNRLIQSALHRHPPPARGNQRLKVYYSTQILSETARPFSTPCFLLFVNNPILLVDTYRAYLIVQIRKHFGFSGLPIALYLRGKQPMKAMQVKD